MTDNFPQPALPGRRINLLLIAVMVMVAAVLGLFPAILTIERPALLAYFAAGALVLGLVYGMAERRDTTAEPGFMEHLLALIGSVFPFSMVASGWIAVYWALRGLILGVNWLADKVGLGWNLDAELIAHYPTLVLAAIGGVIYVVVAVQEYIDLLYPVEFGPRSNLVELSRRRKDLITGFIVVAILLVGVAALFFFNRITHVLFYILLDIIIFFSTVFVYTETLPSETKPAAVSSLVDKVAILLEFSGYRVQMYPGLTSDSMEPFLSNVDLLAQKGELNLAVRVIHPPGSGETPQDWKVASQLRQAAIMLRFERGYPPESMRLWIVLVDTSPDPSLIAFSEEEEILISTTSEVDILRIIEESAVNPEAAPDFLNRLGLEQTPTPPTASLNRIEV